MLTYDMVIGCVICTAGGSYVSYVDPLTSLEVLNFKAVHFHTNAFLRLRIIFLFSTCIVIF